QVQCRGAWLSTTSYAGTVATSMAREAALRVMVARCGHNPSRLRSLSTIFASLAALALALSVLSSAPASAQQPKNEIVPDTWQGDVLRPRPDMHGLDKLTFITDSDYPPFHYFDEVGALTGFNVDLAKAICEELEVQC